MAGRLSRRATTAPVPARLVVVCHQYPPWTLGGLAEYAERFLHHLRRHADGLVVTLYTMNYPGDLPRHSRADGLRIHRPWLPRCLKRRIDTGGGRPSPANLASFGLLLLWFNLAAFAGLCRIDRRDAVLAVHDWQSTPVGILAAGVLRLPVVYHVHNTEQTMTARPDIGDPLRLIRTCQWLMSRLATRIVVPTPEMRSLLARHGWPAARIQVIPHGFETSATVEPPDPRRPDRSARAELLARAGFPADAQLLVFVGRLSPVKGVQTLLRALPEIAAQHPRVRLLVLGIGLPGTGQSASFDRLVSELRLGELVHAYHRYLPRAEVHRHFRAADLCVFPSTYEPFGLVSVEAMGLGVPVVLGPGFSRTISTDGVTATAFRLASNAPSELAQAVKRALADPARAAVVGARGQAHVRRSFNWAAAVVATWEVYRHALAGEPAPTFRGAG